MNKTAKILKMNNSKDINTDYIIMDDFKLIPYARHGLHIEILTDDIPETEMPKIIDEILEYETQKIKTAWKARKQKRRGVKMVSLDAMKDSYDEKTA